MPIRPKRGRKGYEVEVQRDNRRSRRQVGTYAEAKAVEAQLWEELEPAPEHGLEHALLEHLDHVERSRTNSQITDCKRKASAIRPFLSGREISEAPTVANEIKASMASLKPATINRRLALLRRLTYLAYELGWTNDQVGRRIKLLPENNERVVTLTPNQVEEIASLMPTAGDAVRVAAYTGFTRSEVKTIGPEVVRDGKINVTRSKTSTFGLVPIAGPISHIVPAKLPLPISENSLRQEWEAARKKPGMPWLRFHDLRHVFGGWLADLGCSDRQIQELMRLKTVQMVKRYAKLREEGLAKKIGELK